MQNNVKLGIDIMKGLHPDEVAAEIGTKLASIGFEVNRKREGYILLRFRRDSRQWSHIYERTNANGFYMVCSGPEKLAATNKGFKQFKAKGENA